MTPAGWILVILSPAILFVAVVLIGLASSVAVRILSAVDYVLFRRRDYCRCRKPPETP